MGLNTGKTTIVGQVVANPEVKTFKSSSGEFAKAFITVAVNESWKDKTTGQRKEHVEYYRCYNKNADATNMAQFVQKGDLIRIEAKKRERSYEEHISVEGIGPLYMADGKPLMIKRWITEFMITEIGYQPKSWRDGSTATAAGAANAAAGNMVYAGAAPSVAGATPPPPASAPAPAQAPVIKDL